MLPKDLTLTHAQKFCAGQGNTGSDLQPLEFLCDCQGMLLGILPDKEHGWTAKVIKQAQGNL